MQSKPLSTCNVVVTGGSRDIGGGIVLELAKAGARVMSVFRSKPERAQKIADEVKNAGGKPPILMQTDLVTPEGKTALFNSWEKEFKNDIDILVLCASGATMEINVDANMALVDKFLEIRKERLKNPGANNHLPSAGTIVFLQSEPGHFQRVIDGVFDFLDYYRDKVGPAKRAGEDAFRKRLHAMAEAGVRGITVCPPEVTDTFNMKLFELQNKEARTKSRELSNKLGTVAFVTIAEVAERVRKLIEDNTIPNGHLELFDNVKDGMTVLGQIYGDDAIYVHTFEKTGENKGIGRIVVNPKLWGRGNEPKFTGKILNRDKNNFTISLLIAKSHMRGHFRSGLPSLFPGHKSIRTAAVALGRFFEIDGAVDLKRIRLNKYISVKFRSPVLPGDELITKVTMASKIKNCVTGDAVQSVNEKESMDIRGMVVYALRENEESALLLDQLIEAAAQTMGMYILDELKDEDLLPLFHSTGEAEMFKSVNPGDNLMVKAETVRLVKSGGMNIFSGDLEIVVKIDEKEELIASIKTLQGLLLPKEEVLKKLK